MIPVPRDDSRSARIPTSRSGGRLGALALTTAFAMSLGSLAAAPAFGATDGGTGDDGAVVSDAATVAPTPAPTDAPPVTEQPAPENTAAAAADEGSSDGADAAAASEPVEADAPQSAQALAAEAPTSIADVQGTGADSPLAGQTVTVQGVITADYRTGGYKGIVIQTPGTGGAAKTAGASDAVFVYLNGKTVPGAIGDLVSVAGVVGENFGQTQITPAAATDVTVVTTGVGVPDPTPLPASVVGADREAYESMLVVPTGDYAVASSHQLYTYGTLWLNPGELNVKDTEAQRPGDDAKAVAAANRADRILLDDGYNIQISNKEHPGDQPYFTKDVVVRNGDLVDFGDEGLILQYGFDDWRLQPVTPRSSTSEDAVPVAFTASNPRPQSPPAVGGDIQVGSFNVYNYFTTLTSEDKNARGAANAAQFAIQKSKIVAAINGMDAEVVALMEIENSVKLGKPADAALKDLIAGLNAAAGEGTWAYVPTPEALKDPAITDFITSAIIYRTADAKPVGDSATIIDEEVWDNAREPIAQAFDVDGRIVTVVANHFKSKSGTGTQPTDGQGFFNADRVAQAKSLLSFTDQLAKDNKSEDMLLIGDFNAYGQEDPIVEFTSKGWLDTVPAKAKGQYTYSFDGELGSLDHVIASPSLAESITGAGVWTINSPEWSDRGYAFGAAESGTPYRSSDHDPIVVGVAAKAPPVSIDIATINDFHGRIEADQASAGAAVLAGAVQAVRDENPNTIFAAAGDLIGASTFTSFIADDNPTIDALNAAGLQVSAAGNHEFDKGWADLRDRVQERANWEYLSANVFLTETGKPALAPTWVTELEGVRVGFVGAVTEDLDSLVSPDGIKDLEVRSIVDTVNAAADDLRDGDDANGEADVVILLVHEGATTVDVSSITPDSALGEIVYGVDDDVDAIVSAHTHLAYNHVIDGRPVVSAGKYGENLGVMNLQVDPTSKELLSITNEIRPLAKKVGNAWVANYPAVPAVQAIVDAAKAQADVLGARKVGEITDDFNRALQSDGTTENRGGESTIGNFVADVQQWATDADVALMNPGGIRANLAYPSSGSGDPDGNVTYREAATVQPFANTLVTLKLTGAQLKAVLEEQWQPDGSARPFLKLGVSEGLTYTYDPAAARGERITSMTLNGEAVDPTASYTVAANSFLAAGGDNFLTFQEGTDKKDTGKVDLESMVDWFSANTTATPDLTQRAVGVSVTPPAEAYRPGDEVTVTLSSLSFSTDEDKPTTVRFTLGGVDLGSAEVDSTVIDAYDEAGTATFTFTVPEGADGDTLIATPDVGAAVEVPIAFVGADEPANPQPGGGTGGGTGTGTGTGTGSGTGSATGGLATTGADPLPYTALAALLLLAGMALVAVRRRRV